AENLLRVPGYAIGLAHRRLAILDLSAAGRQPMSSPDGHLWVTYNGEIYNYQELRDELRARGRVFRSHSDTEVLLAAYSEWGADCLRRLNGMFAFGLWDTKRRVLFCARDRMGEKPFYYVWDGTTFAFASEIKALLQVVERRHANHKMIYAYLDGARLDFSRETFFEELCQIQPAHYLLIKDATIRQERYWELPASQALGTPAGRDVKEEFRHLLHDAIRLRLRSDVPVGSCLSGGLDSSAIVCVADRLLDRKLKTFSACFEDVRYDERPFIRQVVESTGVESHQTFPTEKELLGCLERLVWQQDEPFGSTSIFAQWMVMQAASAGGIKVVLDGQGADELMAGYHGCFGAHYADLLRQGRWFTLWKEWRAYRRRYAEVPPPLAANFARGVAPAGWVQALRSRYRGSMRWIDPAFAQSSYTVEDEDRHDASLLRGMQHRLLTRHGLRALLRHEDRNSMAFGVEARLPFLDVRLVEFLFRLESKWKLKDGWTKVILRDALQGLLPPGIERRIDKVGFATPEDDWFRGDLGLLARDILFDRRTRERGYFRLPEVEHDLVAHIAGQQSIGSTIWRWVNLEVWCRLFLDQDLCTASLL
ncbi:MAG TPA: asparagine synthase (glutamine-hydrolyzing), partial [Nitrospiraceae bacterium]|nr:asparagine synthase (glutamine-hydrolyzing) [Nitrospiraceae bacterium]